MTLKIKKHSILLLVGPSSCGKSFFAEHIKKQLQADNIYKNETHNRISILSTDNIRAELLCMDETDKFHPEMMSVSQGAFNLLEHKLNELTSYPQNSDAIIIDSTGLQELFREKILAIAKQNRYNVYLVLFNYKNREDYFKFVPDIPIAKSITNRQLKTFKENVLPKLKVKNYTSIFRIKSIDEEISISFEKNMLLKTYGEFKEGDEYFFVGDIHGCFFEFKQLLQKFGYCIENDKIISNEEHPKSKIILVGDIIDKGEYSIEALKFITDNISWFIVVWGNHENFVLKYLNDKIDKIPEEFIDKYFTTIKQYTNGQKEYFKYLLEILYVNSVPFFETNRFVVTHQLCDNLSLGKFDSESIKNSNRKYTNDTKKYIHNTLSDNSNDFFKLHIFGHFAFRDVMAYKNKICLDTGCVYGNKLSGLLLDSKLNKIYYSVPSLEKNNANELLVKEDIFPQREIRLNELNNNRIKYLKQDKINYISGTMSPTDSDVTAQTMETLEKAFELYKNNGCESVVVQPKMMGSRCQMYLDINGNNSYAVSRNGYKIKKNIDIFVLNIKQSAWFGKLKNKFPKAKMFIIDGEIMPWAFLGEELISNTFNAYLNLNRSEFLKLEEYGFFKQYENFHNKIAPEKNKISALNKQELDELYSDVESIEEYKKYSNLYINAKERQKQLETFTEQLTIHGKLCDDSNMFFYGFCLLKVINEDGSEILCSDELLNNNYENFSLLHDRTDLIKRVNLNNFFTTEADNIRNYFNFIYSNNSLEGLVVKPEKIEYSVKYPPYLKVRNSEYLTLVYGMDYKSNNKMKKLVFKKSIKNKLSLSKREWNLGLKMLSIRYDEIHNSDKYDIIVNELINELQIETKLDPRL